MFDSNSFRDNFLTKVTLLEIFENLNQKLEENNLILTINLYGGCVMVLCYDNRPATKDIDAVFDTNPQIQAILGEIASLFSLSKNWINQEIKGPLEKLKKENLNEIKAYSNLSIFTPSIEQMLAMKVLSARSEPYRDFQDAEKLITLLNIKDRKEVLNIFNKFIGLKYLGDRQKMFLNYIGKDLNLNWEEF